ncbi:MAG: hypothetical protein FJ026_07925 [Chloroflexi bacterium]|nr:hypothetical protein [Chloroflexota bacterium]
MPGADAGTERLPFFRAGQYLSLKVAVDGVGVTRPYSIASAPYEALGKDGFYEMTIRQVADGFVTRHIWENWQVGTRVESSAPVGWFYYEPLRDAAKIVGLAGESGIRHSAPWTERLRMAAWTPNCSCSMAAVTSRTSPSTMSSSHWKPVPVARCVWYTC